MKIRAATLSLSLILTAFFSLAEALGLYDKAQTALQSAASSSYLPSPGGIWGSTCVTQANYNCMAPNNVIVGAASGGGLVLPSTDNSGALKPAVPSKNSNDNFQYNY